ERDRAEQEKRIAQMVRDFLRNSLLRQADAVHQADSLLQAGRRAEGRSNLTVRELLDRAAAELVPAKIEANFPKEPVVQAEIIRAVGDAYLGIGEYDKAIDHLER